MNRMNMHTNTNIKQWLRNQVQSNNLMIVRPVKECAHTHTLHSIQVELTVLEVNMQHKFDMLYAIERMLGEQLRAV